MAKAGSGGVHTSLMVHTIGAPPIQHFGSEELKAKVLPGIISGEKISALAITEPGGGSDVAALQTKAIRDGDYYIISVRRRLSHRGFVQITIQLQCVQTQLKQVQKVFQCCSLMRTVKDY